MFGYGIESASPTVLQSMNKRSKLENIVDAIHLSESVGLAFSGNFIFGDPAEDATTIRETMAFFWKHCTKMHIFMGQIQPYPGSLLFKQCIERGMIRDRREFYTSIDERLWNMTRLPDRIWYPWIALIRYFTLMSPWAAQCEAVSVMPVVHEGGADPRWPQGKSLCEVTATCPHCRHSVVFREALPDMAAAGEPQRGFLSRVFGPVLSLREKKYRFRMKVGASSALYLATCFRNPIFSLVKPFMEPFIEGVYFITACPDCGQLVRVVVPQRGGGTTKSGFTNRFMIPLFKRLLPDGAKAKSR